MIRAATATACLLLAACAGTPPRDPTAVPETTVTVAPQVTLAMPSPAALGRRVEAAQMVTARHGADTFVFEGRLSAGPERVLLVGTDSMGRRAMTIRWSGHTLDVEKAVWLPDDLHPENVLADIMLLFWPEAAVRQALTGATLSDDKGRRSIRRDGAEVIGVDYDGDPPGDPWAGVSRLKNTAFGYEIEVRSARVAP